MTCGCEIRKVRKSIGNKRGKYDKNTTKKKKEDNMDYRREQEKYLIK